MYTNEKNDLSNREEYLQNGTILSAYVYRLQIQYLGREKVIVRNRFNSILGNHMCFHCKQDYVALNTARIAHYRSRVPMGEFEYSDTLSNRTELLQQTMHRYFV